MLIGLLVILPERKYADSNKIIDDMNNNAFETEYGLRKNDRTHGKNSSMMIEKKEVSGVVKTMESKLLGLKKMFHCGVLYFKGARKFPNAIYP